MGWAGSKRDDFAREPMSLIGERATTRTSHTHPLQIPSVTPGEGLGRIGISFCPGKWQAAAMTGAWARNLEVDLDAIARWGAVAVVTLVESHELVALRVENSLVAHQPLGSVMRARLQVYRALAAFRQHENGTTPARQTDIAEVPA